MSYEAKIEPFENLSKKRGGELMSDLTTIDQETKNYHPVSTISNSNEAF
jgi:hypothetical protein